MTNPEIVQAREGFVYGDRIVRPRETFDARHEIVKTHPHLFVPVHPDNPYEDASAAPGRKRGK